MKGWITCLAFVVLSGCARGAWLSSTQPGFTADETICRIAGDRTNATALVGATGTLWQAFDAHNHDGRYDPMGAAAGVSNALLLVIGCRYKVSTGPGDVLLPGDVRTGADGGEETSCK